MPNSIADLIYNQMMTAGKPRTTTQTSTGTSTLKQQSPLDIGSLGLLLYLILSGQNKTSPGLGSASSPAALQSFIQGPMSSIGTLPASSYSPASWGQANPLQLILSLLGGTGGLGGSSGLR